MFSSYRNQSVDFSANQLTGFYIMGTLVLKGLNTSKLLDFAGTNSYDSLRLWPSFKFAGYKILAAEEKSTYQ